MVVLIPACVVLVDALELDELAEDALAVALFAEFVSDVAAAAAEAAAAT